MDEYKLYSCLARFDYRVRLIPREDVLQEMRYALLTEKDLHMIHRVAWRMFRRLLRDYGYACLSHETGKREVPFSDFRFPEVEPELPDSDSKADLLFNLYVVENYTASKICKRLGIPYSDKIRDLFKYAYKKRELRKLLRTKQGGVQNNKLK
jgi:hypothetical protein